LTINLDLFAFTSRQTLLWDILWFCAVIFVFWLLLQTALQLH